VVAGLRALLAGTARLQRSPPSAQHPSRPAQRPPPARRAVQRRLRRGCSGRKAAL